MMATSLDRRAEGQRWAALRSGVRAAIGVVVLAWIAALGVLTGCGVEYPNCNGDQDCRAHHEVCVNRHCQQCRTTADCPADHTCLRNRCVDGANACDSDSDCAAGQHCTNHRCGPVTECDATHACPGGAPCQQGHCPPASTGTGTDTDPVDNQGRLCNFQPVYFTFDNATLDDSAQHTLQTAAECMRREGNSRYVLIGRADPRGTTEYNLALGERRARIAQRYLTGLGIADTRIVVSSEGSEAATGTDESGWSHDRRVDFRPRD